MRSWMIIAWATALLAAPHGGSAHASVFASVQAMRSGDCPQASGLAPLRVQAALSRTAELWSKGASLRDSATRSGYAAERISGLHVDGDEAAAAGLLRQRYCSLFSDAALSDVGTFRQGRDVWVVLAAPFVALRADDQQVIARLLTLVNQARAQARHCGATAMPAAAPVRVSSRLSTAAAEHAADMAKHHYFAHVDPDNHSPADRVRHTGYEARVVGENLALGARSEAEVVQGWLHSPGHCENLMDARFTEMGLGFAGAEPPRAGEYWVQVLALPR